MKTGIVEEFGFLRFEIQENQSATSAFQTRKGQPLPREDHIP